MLAFVFSALPLLALVAADDVAPVDERCARTVIVEAGDTCDFISTKYGASTFQLSHVNPLSIDEACEQLQIGSELCLGFEGSDCSKIHTVVEGDTCGHLIDVYGMDDATLRQNNPQINDECTNIYIGEVLCVDTQAFEYPEFDQEKFEIVAETYLPFCDQVGEESA
ncbi:hypothetical protein A1Q2_01317 [Trichosporon asahii var. asahii CBS 8904]|uniref:LysM domain-containing protein n=2 Tax=Trichosporon asahii var. asahii TaxID=189963 RepID=K1VUV0_TRIAC|nr:hypothetical protein A1Q1_05523 [Trichosporon asahii var. asahii CBS 2479]EJT45977.1 hypothetical protein A1Q1_05523 [Trichosporon asahii var. asahii CBS 2479]EKD04286.1 hypothetical protein A1Q2_01317 [Trichosporon asahii var. asahii CBS 8904]